MCGTYNMQGKSEKCIHNFSQKRECLGDLDIVERIMLKWILNK
jgi:hypothetical protein